MKNIYSVNNIINHRTAISVIDRLAEENAITKAEKKYFYKIINTKYGFNSHSIFAA